MGGVGDCQPFSFSLTESFAMSALSKLAALNALRPGAKAEKVKEVAEPVAEKPEASTEFYDDDGVTAEDRSNPFGLTPLGKPASHLARVAAAPVTVTKAADEDEEYEELEDEEYEDEDDSDEEESEDDSVVLDTQTVYEVDVEATEVASFQEVAKALRTIINNSEIVLSVLDRIAELDG